MSITFLDFEKPIAELEGKIEELRHVASNGEVNIADEIAKLQAKADRLLRQSYQKLSPWQKVQVARHPDRPHASHYIDRLIDDFVPLAGDRLFGEDPALLCGLGRFRGRSVAIIGHEKGHDVETRLKHNFGMARPEGYRKAIRLMDLANRFHLPVLSFIDTAGAYPGIGAEERGQAEAIARAMQACLRIGSPFVATVIGEGGSGGAVAIGVADKVLMLEHAVYSVISPEGCASILWRSGAQAAEASNALKLTAQDLQALGVIDGIIEEPLGGAHRGPEEAARRLGDTLEAALEELTYYEAEHLKAQRRRKFLDLGQEGTL